MIDLAKRLMVLGFVPKQDFICQDDGDGPFIREWRSELKQPTVQALSAVVLPDDERPRDLAAELDALTAAIIKKTAVTKEDIEAEAGVISPEAVKR